jgi:hypothetical protein
MADGSNLVTIRDIDVPFWRIVLILVKWSIAAMIILTLLVSLLGALMAEVLGLFGLDFSGTPTSPH